MPLLTELSGSTYAVSPDNGLRSVVLNNMVAASPMLRYARFFTHPGNAYQLPKADPNNITSLQIRDIGTEPTAVTPPPPDYLFTSLRIFTNKVKSDLAYEMQNPGGIAAYHQRNLETYAQALGRDFTNRFINDDPANLPADLRRWIGLKTLCSATVPTEYGLIGGTTRTISFGGANGEVLSDDDTPAAKKAARRFVELMNRVDAATRSSGNGTKVIFMPEEVMFRMASLGLPYLNLTQTTQFLDQPVAFTTWKGIPIIPTGKAHDLSTDIVPYSETQGSSTDCTSIYFVVFNEEADLTFNGNAGVAVEGAKRIENFIETRIEFQAGLALANPQAISRIQGIRLFA